jgi:hypothetical protein
MSNSKRKDLRGQSEGSRRNRFSAENQPKKRRQQRRRGDIASGLVASLRNVVTVNISGVPTKMELHEALARKTERPLRICSAHP